MKRKIISLGISIALIFGLCGCAAGESAQSSADKSLYVQGLEVVSLMAEMAGNEAYLEVYTSNDEVAEAVSAIGEGDYSEPKEVYQLTIPAEAILSLADMADVEKGLSDRLKKFIESKMSAAIISQINSMEGATSLAAVSICAGQKTFVSDELTENTIYLYTYEDAVPAAVVFISGEDNTVLATGYFILNENFKADMQQDIQEYFDGIFMGEFSVEVKPVTK